MGTNGNKYWVCTKYDAKCTSMLTNDVTGEFVKWIGEHHHPPDNAKCEVTKAIASMRKRARGEPHIPVQQIYNAEATELTVSRLDFVINTPHFHSAKHGLYYQRHLLMPNLPTQREDIMLEGVYMKTMDGKDVLAFDNQPQNIIIGYATVDNLRLLCELTDVQCDDTFKTAPKFIHQLQCCQPSRNSRESHGFYSVCFLNSRLPGRSKNLTEFQKIKSIISVDFYSYYLAFFSVRRAEVIAAVYTV